MNLFNKKRHEPVRLEPTHKKMGLREKAYEFWLMNNLGIGLIIVTICISILLIMIGYAAGTGHIHMFSTEANRYEHMNQIILCYGGMLHG